MVCSSDERIALWASWGHDGPRTRARARMEEEAKAEVVLGGSEAAVTRIDHSDDENLHCQFGGMRPVRVKV